MKIILTPTNNRQAEKCREQRRDAEKWRRKQGRGKGVRVKVKVAAFVDEVVG